MYSQLISQRNRELMHVANLVGGVVKHNQWYPVGKEIYNPVPLR
jgi:hypothetical protein